MHVLVSQNCTALVLRRRADADPTLASDGRVLFTDFVHQNALCLWVRVEYCGCLVPSTLLITGTDLALEVLRSAWARRLLRPPKGYVIDKLGDLGVLKMTPVPQTQFAPLSEALCKIVADLVGEQTIATSGAIKRALRETFPEMQVPGDDILHRTLGALIRERKLYHNGKGYVVSSIESWAPSAERPMLMTNEEALVRLHGKTSRECSLAIQVDETDIAAAWNSSSAAFLTATPNQAEVHYLERSHSLKILRMSGRPKSTDENERGGSFKETKRMSFFASEINASLHKGEKQSMLAKILRRMHNLRDRPKHFSAQFPPLEWLHNTQLRHSVATQTALEKIQNQASDPWGQDMHYFDSATGLPKTAHLDVEPQLKNESLPMHSSKHSPLYRYAKKRYRHRRSSSESPKIHKTPTKSISSKSPTDHSEGKVSTISSSSSSMNPKACSSRLSKYKPAVVSPYKYKPATSHTSNDEPKYPPTLISHPMTETSVQLNSNNVKTMTEAKSGEPKVDMKPNNTTLPTFNNSPKVNRPVYQRSADPKRLMDSSVYSPKNFFKPSPNVQQELKHDDDKADSLLSTTLSDAKFVSSSSSSETSSILKEVGIRPLKLKNIKDMPPLLSFTKSPLEFNQNLKNMTSLSNSPKEICHKIKDTPSLSSLTHFNKNLKDSPSLSNTPKEICHKIKDSPSLTQEFNKNLKDPPSLSNNLKDICHSIKDPLSLSNSPKEIFHSIKETPSLSQKPKQMDKNVNEMPTSLLSLTRNPKEIVIDNSVSVEVISPGQNSNNNNNSNVIVTEETTVTKGNRNSKVVTVTSITTTSVTQNKNLNNKEEDHQNILSVNDLNIETEKNARIIDCSSSCNIITEVK